MFSNFDTMVELMIPQYEVNGYGRNEINGYIHHPRRGEINMKHSKWFNIRFGHGSAYEGYGVFRKEDVVLNAKRLRINSVDYDIDSVVPHQQSSRYVEVYFKEVSE